MLKLIESIFLKKNIMIKNVSSSNNVELKAHSDNSVLPDSSVDVLAQTLNIMEQLVGWLVSAGIGHKDFSNALRRVFYNQAIKELENINQKKTDSLISLLSGLDRRDVKSIRENNGTHKVIKSTQIDTTISVPARVIGLWIHLKLPEKIPFTDDIFSFEQLVKEISTEKHPRSILSELIRLKLVEEDNDYVTLNIKSFTPSNEEKESRVLFSSNVSDHIAASLQNLTNKNDFFLEQAVFADELSEHSINILKNYSKELWEEMSVKILDKAIECAHQDKGIKGSNKRFKLGVYQFDNVYINE